MVKTVLAIDPGTGKCGIALARRNEDGRVELLWRAIVARDEIIATIRRAESIEPFTLIVVGSGTGSRELVAAVKMEMPKAAVLTVDERDTSMQARERYWLHNPRTGWRRLLPATLQVPPEAVDDYAALILAERVLGPGAVV